MGKGEDDDVVTDEGVDLGGLDETLGQVDEVGVVLSEEGACGGARGEGADLDLRMGAQETQNLSARVTRRTGDRNCPGHAKTIHGPA